MCPTCVCFKFTVHNCLLQCATTLVSMCDMKILESNLDSALRPLTEKEEEVKDYVEKHFFAPLSQRHWEGVEIAQHRKATQSADN